MPGHAIPYKLNNIMIVLLIEKHVDKPCSAVKTYYFLTNNDTSETVGR